MLCKNEDNLQNSINSGWLVSSLDIWCWITRIEGAPCKAQFFIGDVTEYGSGNNSAACSVTAWM
jgi:hypothetical protein